MADQKINALPTKTSPTTGDKMLMIGAAEEYQIDYDQLADAILNKLTSKTYSLDQGTKSLLAALNELNSKSLYYTTISASADIDNLSEGIYRYNGFRTFAAGTKPFSSSWGIWFVIYNNEEKYEFVINLSTAQIYARAQNNSWISNN